MKLRVMKKKLKWGIVSACCFLVFLILFFLTGYLAGSQQDQTVAERWSREDAAAQVSCFFSVKAAMTEDRLIAFEHTVDSALTDAGVVQTSENPGARLWADAYSAGGRITLSTDRMSLTLDALGVGGDYFLFHPLKLRYGSYFSSDDVNHDCCVIDEDAAWQLFGATEVTGMTVFIGGHPHVVTGVVERQTGRLEEAAGLNASLVYVSYETLEKYGRNTYNINCYEIVMPNPVQEFAYNYIKKNLGADEAETEVVENSSRFSLMSRIKLIGSFGTRSMNGRTIIYPYWENLARGYEDILLALTFLELLFLVCSVGIALVLFVLWWRHKGWTFKSVRLWVQDKAERLVEKLRALRQRKKTEDFGGNFLGEEKPDRPKIKKGRSRWRDIRRKKEEE